MVEAEDQPPQEEGTSARSKGKEPAHIVSSFDKSSSIVCSSSHGGDGGDSETCGTSEFYQHDEQDAVPIEDEQEFPEPSRMDPTCASHRRWRVSPPGHNNEQGNIGGNVGEEQTSWNPSNSDPHSKYWPHPYGPSQYYPYGQVKQEEEQSSALGSYSYGEYGQIQYRYPPPLSHSRIVMPTNTKFKMVGMCNVANIPFGIRAT